MSPTEPEPRFPAPSSGSPSSVFLAQFQRSDKVVLDSMAVTARSQRSCDGRPARALLLGRGLLGRRVIRPSAPRSRQSSITSAFQPRRLMIVPAACCKRRLARAIESLASVSRFARAAYSAWPVECFG